MKKALLYCFLASVILNALLGGFVCYQYVTRKEPPSADTALVRTAPVQPKANPARPFHWQQLDAPDFPGFIKNLRGIGCPEATIHDIIEGELREIHATKRQEMEQKVAGAEPAVQEAIRSQLRQLDAEASAQLSRLLSGKADTPATVASVTSPTPHEATPSENVPPLNGTSTTAMSFALIPSAFLTGDNPEDPIPTETLAVQPTDTSLTPTTASVVTNMRTDFVQSVGEGDPASPDFIRRWRSAKVASDDRFSSLFGGDYFVRAQILAAQKAAQSR